MSKITIDLNKIEEFAKVCACLVKEGVIFSAVIVGDKWVITFSGGF